MITQFPQVDVHHAGDLAAILCGWIEATAWIPDRHTSEQGQAFLFHLIAAQQVTKAGFDDRSARHQAGFPAQDAAEVSCRYLAAFARGQGPGASLLDRAKAASPRLELWTFQANPDARRVSARRVSARRVSARRVCARQGFVEAFKTDGAGNAKKLPDARLIRERAVP